MTKAKPFGTFFVPGPTEVRREILETMTGPMIPHRSSQFEALFVDAQTGLREVFQTRRPVMITASSGTGMMEAAVRCVRKGPVLCLVNGAFSDRFSRIAEACGHEAERYEVGWGEVHDAGRLDHLLSKRQFSAVTVVHSETSTGARNDVKAISDVAHSRGARCLIDSVSGIGGLELRFDEWSLDFALTGSQKALALPPGLAFAAASEDFIAEAAKVPNRGVYLDVVELDTFARQSQTPSTPTISLFYALQAQLRAILEEGIESRWARHAAMADVVWREPELMNIVPPGSRSNTVSALSVPAGWTAGEFLAAVAKRGFSLGGGYGKLRESTFRLGHMGDHTVETVRDCVLACKAVIREKAA